MCCDQDTRLEICSRNCNLRLLYFLQPYGSNATNVAIDIVRSSENFIHSDCYRVMFSTKLMPRTFLEYEFMKKF